MGTSPCLTTTNTIKDQDIKVRPPPVYMELKTRFLWLNEGEVNIGVCFPSDKSENKEIQ